MKKQILISLILLSSVLTVRGQNSEWISTPNTLWTNATVGIGVSTTTAKLEIGTNGDYSSETVLKFIGAQTDPINYNLCFDKVTAQSSGTPYFDWQINQRQYGGNNGNIMTFYRNGNIGIATTTPTAKLEIGANGDHSSETVLKFVGAQTDPTNYSLCFDKVTAQSSGTPYFDWQINQRQYGGNNGNIMTFSSKGNVGIATTNPDPRFKLDVEGTIRASEVKVCLQGGCDFVFKRDYKLMDLKKLEKFVRTNQHLPEIAPEKEMVENGVNMKELQMKLLQKIEELTLYTIEQNKKLEQQNEKITALENEMKEMKKK